MPGEDFLLEAYNLLCTEKGASGLIPWRAIRTYAREYNLDPEMSDFFTRLIIFIDAVQLDKAEKEAEAKRAVERAKNKSTGNKKW